MNEDLEGPSIWRLYAPLALIVLAALATRGLLESGLWEDAFFSLARRLTPGWGSRFDIDAGGRAAALGIAALCVPLTALRFGRVELAAVALFPLLLGGGVLALLYGADVLPRFAFGGVLGAWQGMLALGCLLGLGHSAQLVAWHQAAWRRQTTPARTPTLVATLLAAVSLAAGVDLESPLLLPHQGVLVTYGVMAGSAQLLVPFLMGKLLVLRGTNGTPGLRNIYGGLWILVVMASRGLWFLVTVYPWLRGEARQRAAVEAIHRIARKVVLDAPCGSQGAHLEAGPPLATPGVVVANHVSMFDITSILAMDLPAVIFVKGWVLKTPVMGHMARAAGYLDVEALGAEETLARARVAIASGYSVLVFPEGTRSRDGSKVARFRNGAFALARALGVPVTPIVVSGSVNIVRAGTWWLGYFESRTEVLEPLDPGDFTGELADKRMANEARERVRAAYWRLWPSTQECVHWDYALAGMYRYLGATVGHYVASKFKRDPLLLALPKLCPGEGPVLHAGCGLALASARLALFDPRRSIRGIDLDPRKIELARAALGETTGARFEVGDLRQVDLGQVDLVLLIDVLHYWPPEVQDTLLTRLAAALRPGGRLVFRDGVAGAGGHGWIELGERLATGSGFTRAGSSLQFESAAELRQRLERAGFAVRSEHPELGLGSNLVLVCERAGEPATGAGTEA